MAGSDWGAGRESMMMIYRAMMRSAIDYGCMVYGSAAFSVFNKLDIVQASLKSVALKDADPRLSKTNFC